MISLYVSSDTARRFIEHSSPEAIVFIGVILFGQLGLLGLYLNSIGGQLLAFHIYPIIWITVSVWILWHARPPQTSVRRQFAAGIVGILYFLLLAWLSGLFSTGLFAGDVAFAGGLRLEASAPPGYAPTLFYSGSTMTLAIMPYLLIGYATLTYLVYITILDAWAASASGLLGIFGCVGCSWPIIAALAGGATGPLAATVYSYAYPISTVAFLLAAALLYWRPSFSTIRRWLG